MNGRRHTRLWILVAAASTIVLAAAWLGTYLRAPRLTPELRGRELAENLGCFACHGPGGVGGVPNPGSTEKEIPAWDGGTAMMYVEEESEIAEWILFGRPHRLSGQSGALPDSASADGLPVRMRAYRDLVSVGELADLVAYFKAVAAYDKPPPGRALDGYAVARQSGCFGCHGPGGLLGSTNPRSFKGYIPPWRGPDYSELVRSDDELTQWITEGKIDRFERNRLANHFTRRQLIRMPAYGEMLTEEQLESLMAYIRWLQE